MRTAVYVDGFNLFHRLLEGRPDVKWLDLFAVAQTCLNDKNEVVLVRYFTARVSGTDSDPDQPTRQDVYLRALHATGVQIHYGTFRVRQKRARLVDPEPDADCYARVWTREEKGSDVNLAVHMLHDAWENVYDCAVVISNDSDLAEALRLVRSMGKVVGVLCPTNSGAVRALQINADFVHLVRPVHLLNSQLPDPVCLGDGGEISCPPRWRSPVTPSALPT